VPARRRPAPLILVKLVVAYTVPTVFLFALFAYYSYDLARRDLDAELGRRLAAVATATATQVRGKYLIEMDPEAGVPRAYLNTRRKLEAVRVQAGLERILVFAPDFTSLCDTGEVPIGYRYHDLELDRHEIARALKGEASATVLFRGNDGRYYKAGYAPVMASEDDHTIVAALRVEAPAEFFRELTRMRWRLITHAGALAGAVVLISLVVAALLTRPLRRLSAAAERIGKGELEAPVPSGRDEIGFLGATLDEMRVALRARDERLQMMLAGIAHEVRNPLGGIELFAGILRDDLAGDGEKLAHVARIEKELGHLKAVVGDFLDYARRPKPERAPVAVAPLLAEVRDLCAPDAAGVTLIVDAPADLHACGDAGQLRRAFLNLARNAVQATPSGEVRLAARAAGPRVVITISDTGKGIPEAERERIFAPFYTTKEKGTGLGLAFVKEIVADHEGTIRVDSGPGGTTFTVEIDAVC
jgi:signal transduction histidine kinase